MLGAGYGVCSVIAGTHWELVVQTLHRFLQPGIDLPVMLVMFKKHTITVHSTPITLPADSII